MKQIQSVQNSLIKKILKLQEKSRERKRQQLFVVEGKREIELAFKGQFEIDSLLFIPQKIEHDYLNQFNARDVIEITSEVYEKIAYRESTEGIIAIVKSKYMDLNSLIFKNKKPLILVLEGVEKPGNIGAMIRTADAANIDAIILADPKTDPYNPNLIRSSVGGVFTKNIIVSSSEEAIAFFRKKNIKMYAATLQNSNRYTDENFIEASAIIVGTEANGLTQIWRNHSIKNINIPMQGEIDSMNVSVAAAIILFEAKRQRNFK